MNFGGPTASALHTYVCASVCVLALSGCGAQAVPEAKSVEKGQVPGFSGSANGIDDPRCDVEGRGDRAKVISQALAAQHGSIQRVFVTGANKEDGKRVVRCREVDTNLDGIKDLVRTYTDAGEPLLELADTDYDGEVDTWITFARGVVAHMEVDHNADGKPDEFKFYSQGVLAKVQRDSDLDGKVDTWEIYDRGRLNRLGIDKNGDENVDRWYRDPGLERSASSDAGKQEETPESKQGSSAQSQPTGAEPTAQGDAKDGP